MVSFSFDIIGFCFFLTVFPTSHGLVPMTCVHNVTSRDKVCCPTPYGYNHPCGGSGRGVCDKVYIHLESIESVFEIDDRINWPIRFFKSMCRCEGNFFGIACESCWYGWEGRNCDKRVVKTRRNIFSFSEKERKAFLHILQISHSKPSEFTILEESSPKHSDPLYKPRFIPVTFQQYIAFIHRYASRSTLFNSKNMCDKFGYMDFNHNTVSFSTWHRTLMLHWERELAKIAFKEYNWKHFAIPYWDWVDARECEVCKNHLVGATGKYDDAQNIWLLDRRSPFYNWTEYCSPPEDQNQCVGCHFRETFPPLNRKYLANDFPKTKDLTFALRRSSYYLKDEKKNHMRDCRSFHEALEGFCGNPEDKGKYLYMHNKVHNMVHGSMCCASTASNDPLFILHHSQIDRIVECWFKIFSPTITQLPNHGVEPGNSRESNVVGYLPPVKHGQVFIEMRKLGIKYDNMRFGRKGFECSEMAEWIRNNKI